MFLPCINSVWVGRTTWLATKLSLIVMIFMNNSELIFRKWIGLYYQILFCFINLCQQNYLTKIKAKKVYLSSVKNVEQV
jgi:hypothetical protein